MLTAITNCLADQGVAARNNFFISHRAALSGREFDGGEVVCW